MLYGQRQSAVRSAYLEQLEDHARDILRAAEALRNGKDYRDLDPDKPAPEIGIEAQIYNRTPTLKSLVEMEDKLSDVRFSLEMCFEV